MVRRPDRARSGPARRRRAAAAAAARVLLAAAALAGLGMASCAGKGGAEASTGAPLQGGRIKVAGGSVPKDPNAKPMTPVERSKLLSRVRYDPGQLQKLTLRERRELYRMVGSSKSDED